MFKLINDKGLKPGIFKQANNFLGQMLSIEEQEMLLEEDVIKKQPPEGFVSVSSFSRSIGISKRRTLNVANELGFELPEYFFSTHLGLGLSPEIQEKVLARVMEVGIRKRAR